MLLESGLHFVVLISSVSLPQIVAQIAQGWREAFPKKRFSTALLDYLGQKEVDVAFWKGMPEEARAKYLTQWRAGYQGQGGWLDGWSIFLESIPGKQFSPLNC